MALTFDRRIVSEKTLSLLVACQARVPFHLGGGAALAGVHLRHRLSADVDLFVHERTAHRELLMAFMDVAAGLDFAPRILRDAGTFARVEVGHGTASIEVDIVHDAVADLEAPATSIEGITIESLADLRANKLTCILSRSEPRDLVDLMFLDRAGFPPERDLPLALKKDAGIDPGALAWLLGEFPVAPLPLMLVPLDQEQLQAFRDDLRERLRKLAVP
jgi:hypothetical protein